MPSTMQMSSSAPSPAMFLYLLGGPGSACLLLIHKSVSEKSKNLKKTSFRNFSTCGQVKNQTTHKVTESKEISL